MGGEKSEGDPCKRCHSNVKYVANGKCVICTDERNQKASTKRFACKTLSVGIAAPYRECYEQGYNAKKNTNNPYPISEIGKRCAWYAGFNDHYNKEIK